MRKTLGLRFKVQVVDRYKGQEMPGWRRELGLDDCTTIYPHNLAGTRTHDHNSHLILLTSSTGHHEVQRRCCAVGDRRRGAL